MKLRYIVFAVMLASGSVAMFTDYGKGLTEKVLRQILLYQVEKTAGNLREALPQRLENATLVDVQTVGTVFEQKIVLDVTRQQIDLAHFKAESKKQLLSICRNEQMLPFLKKGISYKYIYLSHDGVGLHTILIGRKQCRHIWKKLTKQ